MRGIGQWVSGPGTHLAKKNLFVFAQKSDKFQFMVNGMWTVRRWHSTGSKSHPHICAFGSRTIRRACVYEALNFLHTPRTKNGEYLPHSFSLHRNLITTRISQFLDNRSICKSIFEHTYSTNNVFIWCDYFCTNFVYLRQHPPDISAHRCYYGTNQKIVAMTFGKPLI